MNSPTPYPALLSACKLSTITPHFLQSTSQQGQVRGRSLPLKQTLLELAVARNGRAWVNKTTSHLEVGDSGLGYSPGGHPFCLFDLLKKYWSVSHYVHAEVLRW